jgi:two-component system, response regulator
VVAHAMDVDTPTSTLSLSRASERMSEHPEVEILLVEDNPNDVELTLRALKARNLANQVFVARDGAEALAFFFGQEGHPLKEFGVTPRVILLDLKLPKVDGLEVLKRLKADHRTRSLPVVVLTSSREEPDIAAAYRLGASSYIVKPVDFEAFARAVSEVGLYWLLLNEQPR